MKPETFIVYADGHSPYIHRPTFRCMSEFIEANPVSGVVDLGDTFDNSNISHHTKGRPGLRGVGSYQLDTLNYKDEFLLPLEASLAVSRKKFGIKSQLKIRVKGNHDDWEEDLYEEQPELRGVLDRDPMFMELGWRIIPIGKTFQYGKLSYAHGENLGGQNHAKKAVETYCRNLVYGHHHTLQTAVKVLPQDQKQKWLACCLPVLGTVNPEYAKGRPNAYVNGFGIVLYHGSEKSFNLYPVVTTNGRFAWGNSIYGA